ncbi:MAG: gluconolaconase [Acetobacteraceae bacterium]|nr:gluconolaconase [Acetobacteraceae bacterium]MSP30712.1 gluconolaconase [Acetobacteraceae bacterium]
MANVIQTLVPGLAFPEGPRWHDGRLWFSDIHGLDIIATDLGGRVEKIASIVESPSGLGWTADGKLLVVSMNDRRLLRQKAGGFVTHADLSALAKGPCNDMVVTPAGRAYIGSFGFDMWAGAERALASIIKVEPDGNASIAADGLDFPNGMVITPDGKGLIVAESYGGRLTRFDVAADGSLINRRLFAELPGVVPDGICLDAEGAVWVGHARAPQCLRVFEGGRIDRVVQTGEGRHVYACMLGGAERRTLLMCTSATRGLESATARTGRIEFTHVDIPGAGWP